MEPRIQYATTSDGVGIAYCLAGEGPTLVAVPNIPISHVQRGPERFPENFASLRESFRHVWYDARGSGLSDRSNLDYSLDAKLRDLTAVVSSVADGPVVLSASYDGVPVAIAYAAQYPEDVSHLALDNGWSRYSDYYELPTIRAEEAMRGQDWVLYTETLGKVLSGIDDPALAEHAGAYIRECVEPEALTAAWRTQEKVDVSELLPKVQARTLVVHSTANRFISLASARRSSIGHSRCSAAGCYRHELSHVPRPP